MLLEIYNHSRRQQVPVSNNKAVKEPFIKWNKITQVTLPYFEITWLWLVRLLAPVSKSGVYRIMSRAWINLYLWMNNRGKWMFFKPPEQYQLLKWVQSLVTTRSVNNFKEDWKDGIVLCALIEGISPGACPRYDVLHPKQEQLNVELGLRLAESHLGLFSELTVTEILNMDDKTATKLQIFVAQLHSVYQLISGMNPKPCCLPLSARTSDLEWNKALMDHPNCFAKGMGLLMAVKGKAASFNIYLQTYEFMDIVIEIKGRDNDDYCTERITLRSPRKKELINNQSSAPSLTPLASGKIINIPLEYVILSRKIAVTYIPPSAGLYELSIISRGQHIFGSPFEVRIDNVSNDTCNTSASAMPLLDSCLPRQDSDELESTAENKLPMQFLKTLDSSPYGLVKKRRLIKSIVLREYAMIELQPGEPLPQDPRAWSALTTESSILLNSSDEIQRDQHLAENVEQSESPKDDHRNDPCTVSELNGKETQGIENVANKVIPEEEQALEVNSEIGSNETEQHLEPMEILRAMEEKQSCSFDGICELQISENIFIQQHSKTSSPILRQDPEGLEERCDDNYAEIEKHRLNDQQTSEIIFPSIVQIRSPSFKTVQGVTKNSLVPRVPARLIDEWSDLWTPNGESIVKVRVKEWENLPKM